MFVGLGIGLNWTTLHDPIVKSPTPSMHTSVWPPMYVNCCILSILFHCIFGSAYNTIITWSHIADMNKTVEIQGEDSSDKLGFLLQLGQNSSSIASWTKCSDGKGNQDHLTGENLCLCSGNIYLNGCCSKHRTSQRNRTKSAPSLVLELNQPEKARYLAMFRDFYEIPETTEIA
jgi:hypothetical protein